MEGGADGHGRQEAREDTSWKVCIQLPAKGSDYDFVELKGGREQNLGGRGLEMGWKSKPFLIKTRD